MKVLVTGGCGFVGSHTCEYYARHGNEVISFDNMTKYELGRTGYATEAARNYNWDILDKAGVKMVKGDVRDYDHLEEVAEGCDFIVHTAAQPAMTISVESPELDFSTNVRGTFNILQAAHKYKIPLVSCATIHVYGNKINDDLREGETRYILEPSEIDESHPVMEGTLTPLHASKMAAELYVQTFIDSYGLEAASFRLTGLYGPNQFGGEDHGWVANFAIRSVLGIPLVIYGTGKQVRDILFVTDVVEAFDAFYRERKTGIYNIGSRYENSISLLECIDLIGKISGEKPEVEFRESRHGDLQYFVCDSSKAKQILGWESKVPPEQGVESLIDWIRDNIEIFQTNPDR
jgi:CDP-paratose 2-epimerase